VDDSLDRLRLTSQMDQMTAALVQLASALSRYRTALIAEGFSPLEAMDMVKSYQEAMLNGMYSKSKEQ
jgi:hypothetical protein